MVGKCGHWWSHKETGPCGSKSDPIIAYMKDMTKLNIVKITNYFVNVIYF